MPGFAEPKNLPSDNQMKIPCGSNLLVAWGSARLGILLKCGLLGGRSRCQLRRGVKLSFGEILGIAFFGPNKGGKSAEIALFFWNCFDGFHQMPSALGSMCVCVRH